jgi:2-polyprenyl-6-hydroxyphenyl methylase/3-demethylubiquinone-9 3-methyltransferase
MADPRARFYDTIADEFDTLSNQYDTRRRLEIVFDELLGETNLAGQSVLDVGCGTGWFSQWAAERGARVTSLDIGIRLLDQARRKCPTRAVAADACHLPLASNTFDTVISSECIEHTIAPRLALREIHRVTRPGGLMVVTVPNQRWHFAITIANALKLRPFHGYENWLRWSELRDELTRAGARIEQLRGFHLVPPIIPAMRPLLRALDSYGTSLGPIMLNLAVLGRKKGG